ncbi:hypothetical protein CHISP_3084 [Chitinispirillum alkaliphilum]|nr:hypothetical protein CHISP_3084 [Chitinispirillum alkaliphilum]
MCKDNGSASQAVAKLSLLAITRFSGRTSFWLSPLSGWNTGGIPQGNTDCIPTTLPIPFSDKPPRSEENLSPVVGFEVLVIEILYTKSLNIYDYAQYFVFFYYCIPVRTIVKRYIWLNSLMHNAHLPSKTTKPFPLSLFLSLICRQPLIRKPALCRIYLFFSLPYKNFGPR